MFGCVLDSKPSGHVFAPAKLITPGFENELCMRLGTDLAGSVNLEEARQAVAAVHPSLEIIETRGPFSEQIALAMADNAQQKTVILGEPVPLPDNRAAIEAQVSINGQVVATGRGDAVLGDPLNSIVWLARKLGDYGRRLRAGDIVMTGSFTRQFPIAPGDDIETVFSGVGAGQNGNVTLIPLRKWLARDRASQASYLRMTAILTLMPIFTIIFGRRVRCCLHRISPFG